MIQNYFSRALAPALLFALPLGGCAMSNPFQAGTVPPAATVPVTMTYADAADLALAAPVIVDLSVDRVVALDPERAPGLPAGLTRYYVEANVLTLLRGQGGVPARLDFLVDALAPPGRARRYIAFAKPVPGRPASIQLVRANSLIAWSPENEAVTRAATQEAVAINAPPSMAWLGQAFHFPGQVEGEGETQIFLETDGGEPVSLRIVSRPGEQRRWGISLGDVVAADPAPPPQNSLLWYRLSCESLPTRIDAGAIASKSKAYEAQIRSDYQYVRDSLGPCPRNLSALESSKGLASTNRVYLASNPDDFSGEPLPVPTSKYCPGFPLSQEFPLDARCPHGEYTKVCPGFTGSRFPLTQPCPDPISEDEEQSKGAPPSHAKA